MGELGQDGAKDLELLAGVAPDIRQSAAMRDHSARRR